MPTVRDATDADRAAVRDCHVASIRGLGGAAYDDAVVEAWVAADDRDPEDYPVGEPGVEFLVAERDSQVVGFGEVRGADPDDYAVEADGEVRAVYVHPDHAGEGVGSALLAALERRARDRGFDALALTASRNAVPFYEQHGYERVRELIHEFGGEVPGTAVVMWRALD